MTNYASLNQILVSLPADLAGQGLLDSVSQPLVDRWLAEYGGQWGTANVITTSAGQQQTHYLFDISACRLIAAWALSKGKHLGKRDSNRMRGFPLSDGPLYHRGHAIPHSMGGQLDINLVPQLGRINTGPFRRLERMAVDHPGSVYFSYWQYRDATTQRPFAVEQGLLMAGRAPDIARHIN